MRELVLVLLFSCISSLYLKLLENVINVLCIYIYIYMYITEIIRKENWSRHINTHTHAHLRSRSFSMHCDGEGKVDYYLTQFLTGHGSFRHYVNKFRDNRYPNYMRTKLDADRAMHNCPTLTTYDRSGWQPSRDTEGPK